MKYTLYMADAAGEHFDVKHAQQFTLESPLPLTKPAAVRRAKALVGWARKRCRVENYGYAVVLRPHGEVRALFIVDAEGNSRW